MKQNFNKLVAIVFSAFSLGGCAASSASSLQVMPPSSFAAELTSPSSLKPLGNGNLTLILDTHLRPERRPQLKLSCSNPKQPDETYASVTPRIDQLSIQEGSAQIQLSCPNGVPVKMTPLPGTVCNPGQTKCWSIEAREKDRF